MMRRFQKEFLQGHYSFFSKAQGIGGSFENPAYPYNVPWHGSTVLAILSCRALSAKRPLLKGATSHPKTE
jgi:hypothetical protein